MGRLEAAKPTPWPEWNKSSTRKFSNLMKAMESFPELSKIYGTFLFIQEILTEKWRKIFNQSLLYLNLQLANQRSTKPRVRSTALPVESCQWLLR
jgi:hypothetical protein